MAIECMMQRSKDKSTPLLDQIHRIHPFFHAISGWTILLRNQRRKNNSQKN